MLEILNAIGGTALELILSVALTIAWSRSADHTEKVKRK